MHLGIVDFEYPAVCIHGNLEAAAACMESWRPSEYDGHVRAYRRMLEYVGGGRKII
jgi:hypothetical protein